MPAFDADVLKTDPAVIALGDATNGAPLAERVREAARTPRRESPACQAAIASYRTALIFRVLFTVLVFVVSAAAAAAIVYCVYVIATDGADVSAIVTGVSGAVASGATVFLVRGMRQSTSLARQALGDVGTYCGTDVKAEVQG
ncbi:MAG TPA: hypothetical protein VFS37_10785 [Conexibacter sp.]|nr:hypothetical protein [Conexibacter sp.]